MEKIVEVLTNLILSLLGVIVPITGLMMSVFQRGFDLLKIQYNQQKEQLEKQLKEQMEKESKEDEVDTHNIKKTIAEIEKAKKSATSKLLRLDPRRQIIELAGLLSLSLLGTVLWNLLGAREINIVWLSIEIRNVALLLGFLFLVLAIRSLWYLLDVLIEGKAAIDSAEEQNERTLIELQRSSQSTLNSEKLSVLLATQDKEIIVMNGEGDKTLELILNEKIELKVKFHNEDNRMAKNLEIGLIFPSKDFLIERSSSYSIYFDSENNIVRYNTEIVQANTVLNFATPITLTALSEGEFKIKTFIKGENILPKEDSLVVKV